MSQIGYRWLYSHLYCISNAALVYPIEGKPEFVILKLSHFISLMASIHFGSLEDVQQCVSRCQLIALQVTK